ncbi:PRC-barrel domain-containing protein [Roseococcus suduntuyensis]|uniref:PRC-barrel domain-containing protein n=1 Tax=Roseococcus suduntuyensis TaxID=455361 RepID=A0A840AJQ7_9PROT|nr:PRC-barrel domain-containing protein [Roseococcus suduntuyensis]MBB3900265.1 hypothetical protein [Roseococcus suduntuyensis]
MSDNHRSTTPGAAYGDVARDETHTLISSYKIEGTSVYDPNRQHLGSVHSVMIGKEDGKVAYAVLTFGGFLGLGSRYYPIPWSELTYVPGQDGYVTSLTEAQLTGAPSYDSYDEAGWGDTGWRGAVDRHYVSPGTSARTLGGSGRI